MLMAATKKIHPGWKTKNNLALYRTKTWCTQNESVTNNNRGGCRYTKHIHSLHSLTLLRLRWPRDSGVSAKNKTKKTVRRSARAADPFGVHYRFYIPLYTVYRIPLTMIRHGPNWTEERCKNRCRVVRTGETGVVWLSSSGPHNKKNKPVIHLFTSSVPAGQNNNLLKKNLLEPCT